MNNTYISFHALFKFRHSKLIILITLQSGNGPCYPTPITPSKSPSSLPLNLQTAPVRPQTGPLPPRTPSGSAPARSQPGPTPARTPTGSAPPRSQRLRECSLCGSTEHLRRDCPRPRKNAVPVRALDFCVRCYGDHPWHKCPSQGQFCTICKNANRAGLAYGHLRFVSHFIIKHSWF